MFHKPEKGHHLSRENLRKGAEYIHDFELVNLVSVHRSSIIIEVQFLEIRCNTSAVGPKRVQKNCFGKGTIDQNLWFVGFSF